MTFIGIIVNRLHRHFSWPVIGLVACAVIIIIQDAADHP